MLGSCPKVCRFESCLWQKMIVLTYFMCALLLGSASMVIISRNPLHSVLFLVTSFLSASMLLFLFENEFLALFFLIIYLIGNKFFLDKKTKKFVFISLESRYSRQLCWTCRPEAGRLWNLPSWLRLIVGESFGRPRRGLPRRCSSDSFWPSRPPAIAGSRWPDCSWWIARGDWTRQSRRCSSPSSLRRGLPPSSSSSCCSASGTSAPAA